MIGVAPETFPGMPIFAHPDFYMPLAMARSVFDQSPKEIFRGPRRSRIKRKARLKPGMTLQQAQSELAVLAKNFEREYPKINRNRGAAVHTQFEMRTQGDDEQLEIRRDLC